jgi:hypothetical protein
LKEVLQLVLKEVLQLVLKEVLQLALAKVVAERLLWEAMELVVVVSLAAGRTRARAVVLPSRRRLRSRLRVAAGRTRELADPPGRVSGHQDHRHRRHRVAAVA